MATKKPVLVIAIGKMPAGKKNGFKPCSDCKSPAKCKGAGKCMAKGK